MNSSRFQGLKNQSRETRLEGIDGAAGVGGAGVEAGGDLQAALVVQPVKEIEAAFQAGPRGLRGRGARVGPEFARLHGAHLRAQAGGRAEGDLLLEAHLGQPQPEIAGAGQRRNADLRQRTGFARIEDGLLQAGGDRAGLPIDLNGGGAHAEWLLVVAGEEIHVDGAVHAGRPRR